MDQFSFHDLGNAFKPKEPLCADKRSEKDCKYWAGNGNCENQYAVWMHENCMKSCGCGNYFQTLNPNEYNSFNVYRIVGLSIHCRLCLR